MLLSLALLILRYTFVALLFLFIFRLVKWMVGDLKGPARQVLYEPSAAELSPEKRVGREAGGVRLMVIESSLPELEPGDILGVGREVVIGRGADSDILVADSFASTRHARVYLKDEQYWLEDLSSTNGTFLNEVQITHPTVLANEDRVRVGGVTFQFVRWGHEVGPGN